MLCANRLKYHIEWLRVKVSKIYVEMDNELTLDMELLKQDLYRSIREIK